MTARPGTDRILDELIAGRWILTIEGTPPDTEYVAYRPIGWTGPGNSHERIAAPTRPRLLAALIDRHRNGETPVAHTPAPQPTASEPTAPRTGPDRPLTPSERRHDQVMARYGRYQDQIASQERAQGRAGDTRG
ncbi:hypothetical protein GCM10007079_48510 [Nocardiopsis terrae]|uniref:Uncharacterized protein n=1 Tax=Nocardiopsis terrae TaxID=372655 RepID=A0ABR9HAJ4_9ACTN|nr:hypothetical protein [Nocardiopsis terrae]MBE1456033.1 hypothetical protein [Nocardiopsis terrae]GHC96211.1 hypothetical protein GCM10007079_48510 [Nocardiopsis terrae]